MPDLLRLRGAKERDLRLDISGRDRVDPGEPNKLDRQRLAQVNYGRFGGVVRTLELGNVGDVAADAGRGNKAAGFEVLQLLAVDGSALLLLPPPVKAGSARTVKGAVDVGPHDPLVVLDLAIQGGAIFPGNARVGDKDVQSAVKIGDDPVNGVRDSFVGRDVDLVRLACSVSDFAGTTHGRTSTKARHTLDAIGLFDIGSAVHGLVVGVVPDGDIGARLSEPLGDAEPDAGAGARDDGRLAFQGEQWQDTVRLGGLGGIVRKISILHTSHGADVVR